MNQVTRRAILPEPALRITDGLFQQNLESLIYDAGKDFACHV
jgi:hypothetical protein